MLRKDRFPPPPSTRVPAHLEFPPPGSELRRELSALGLAPQTRTALLLLPAVQLAWAARGGPSQAAHEMIEDAAHQFGLDSSNAEVVEHWLTEQPSPSWTQRAYRVLRQLANSPQELHLTWDSLSTALVCAENVASLDTDEELGLPLLSVACLELGIDIGQPWADLEVELGGFPTLHDGRLPRLHPELQRNRKAV